MFGNGNRKKDQKNRMSETNEMHSRSVWHDQQKMRERERERESQQHQNIGNSNITPNKKKATKGEERSKTTRTIRR